MQIILRELTYTTMANEIAIKQKVNIKPKFDVKSLKKKKLRNNEYYGTQAGFDYLYKASSNNKIFTNLCDIITDEKILKLAFRNIKSNTGSKTCGTDGLTIADIKCMDEEKYLSKIRKRLSWFEPQSVKRVEIPPAPLG